MYDLKNFDNWIEDKESGKFGTGASEKMWLINPETKQKGLFKFPKVKTDGSVTGEYWAEKLAYEIGKLINVKCAKVDIGTFNGRIGSISYDLVRENERLDEGISFIQQNYPMYDKRKLIDEYSGEKYSFQMIKKCLHNDYMDNIFQMIVFDALIGNSDRHPNNWAVILNNGVIQDFSPLYDNGSSLCAYENNVEIFFKDSMKYNALINSKSKSMIGWNNTRPIRHFELLQHIKDEYFENTKDYVKILKDNINEENIQNILDNFSDNIISNDMKKLLLKFVNDRKNIILKIYDMNNEV